MLKALKEDKILGFPVWMFIIVDVIMIFLARMDWLLTDMVGALAFALSVHSLLGARNDAEVVLGVLEIVFSHHRVARRLRVASQLQILFCDMGSVAAHLHVGAVALVIARQWVDVLAPAIPVALPVLVLVVRSHRVALSNS